jgi:hypothetical protein
MVRWTVDFYAYQEKLRRLRKKEDRIKIRSPKYQKFEDVLEEYKDVIPEKQLKELKKDIRARETSTSTMPTPSTITDSPRTSLRVTFFPSSLA